MRRGKRRNKGMRKEGKRERGKGKGRAPQAV
jgi:hypothetical protein